MSDSGSVGWASSFVSSFVLFFLYSVESYDDASAPEDYVRPSQSFPGCFGLPYQVKFVFTPNIAYTRVINTGMVLFENSN